MAFFAGVPQGLAASVPSKKTSPYQLRAENEPETLKHLLRGVVGEHWILRTFCACVKYETASSTAKYRDLQAPYN